MELVIRQGKREHLADSAASIAGKVISLAERLRRRREELGITQSQAARELDVARTAYRLWELEAAKPAPDRWRLIASWLGVSVTTMLLAEDLLTDEEAAQSTLVELDFTRTTGRDWDDVGASKPGDFFSQARALLEARPHGPVRVGAAACFERPAWMPRPQGKRRAPRFRTRLHL